jgi:PAS domain S-box-containing protein
MSKIPEAVLQLLDPRHDAAESAGTWLGADTTKVGDVCFVVGESDSAAAARPGPDSPLAELWKHDDFLARFQALTERCLAGEEMHDETSFELTDSGSHSLELNFYPHAAAGRRQAIVVVRDVTPRKRAAAQLQVLLEIVHLLSISPDLPSAINAILRALCEFSRWPVGELWRPQPDGTVEVTSAVHRPDFAAGAEFQRDVAGLTLQVNPGRLAEIAASGPAFVTDLAADAGLFRAKAAARAGLRSAFIIPLGHAGETPAFLTFFLTGDQAPNGHWTTLARMLAGELGAVFQRERQQAHLETFFAHSPDLHCVTTTEGMLKRVNPAWTQALGFAPGDLLGRPLAEFVHPDDRARLLESLAALARGEEVTAFEARHLTRDGTERWILWNATPLPAQHLVIATGRDITHRKISETAVIRSEEHYRDLFHQAYQMQENLRRMSDRVLKVQEHERQRISRDLHDEVGQALTAINVNLAILRTSLGPVTADSARRLSETQHLIEQTMGNIHNFSRELRPAMLDDLGLLPALRNYVKSFGERTGLAVRLDTTQSENIEQLDSERKVVVYRIVQEGLTNVSKHAHARQVDIIVTGSQHDVRLQLSDDGQGFVPGAQPPEAVPRQLGLMGLGERVRLVGGEFTIQSTPGRGTSLRATIPFKLV